MSTVTVFRFELYDIKTDAYQVSRRWATREVIELLGGRLLGSGVDVDESHVGGDIPGMTERDVDPLPRSFFKPGSQDSNAFLDSTARHLSLRSAFSRRPIMSPPKACVELDKKGFVSTGTAISPGAADTERWRGVGRGRPGGRRRRQRPLRHRRTGR